MWLELLFWDATVQDATWYLLKNLATLKIHIEIASCWPFKLLLMCYCGLPIESKFVCLTGFLNNLFADNTRFCDDRISMDQRPYKNSGSGSGLPDSSYLDDRLRKIGFGCGFRFISFSKSDTSSGLVSTSLQHIGFDSIIRASAKIFTRSGSRVRIQFSIFLFDDKRQR